MKVRVKCPKCKYEFFVSLDKEEENIAGFSVIEIKCPTCGEVIAINVDNIIDEITEEDDMYDWYREESIFE